MKITKNIIEKQCGQSLLLAAIIFGWFSGNARAQQSAGTAESQTPAKVASSSAAPYEIEIPATKQWVDTNIDLHAGEKIRLTTTGTIGYPASQSSKSQEGQTITPDGLARGWKDLIHQYAVPNSGHGALIGRLGSTDSGQPFLIGASKEYQAPVAERLFLGINQSLNDASNATGNFHVTIEVLDPGLTTEGAALGGPAEAPIPSITSAILGEVPRRVSDPQGNPGDMVNVFIVGTQDQVVQVFTAAGWVQVDSSVRNTVVAGLIDSLSKEDYLTMPMSTLYLFDRPQDYGFAHAEPVRVAMSRNHLRVWKSKYEVDGRPLWCIAATHDIGFERDQRNNGVTHKIDPAIDGEREYVNDTLSSTGLVIQRTHVTPSDALIEAKTATGGSFHSDGRILVLILKNTSAVAGSNN
jgi:LssY C-terminus